MSRPGQRIVTALTQLHKHNGNNSKQDFSFNIKGKYVLFAFVGGIAGYYLTKNDPNCIKSKLGTKEGFRFEELCSEKAKHAKIARTGLESSALAYKALDQFEEIYLSDDHGRRHRYHATRIQTGNDALVPWLLPPDTVELECKNDINVGLTFKGTNSVAGVVRDFETPRGPGNASYWENNLDILKQLNEKMAEFISRADVKAALAQNRNIRLIISGHSLGGADAQICLFSILKNLSLPMTDLDKQKTLHGLNKQLKLRLVVRNSPGIKQEFADAMETLMKNYFSTVDIGIEVYFIFNKGDPIHEVGDTHLLSVFNRWPNVLSVCMEFDPLAEEKSFYNVFSRAKFASHREIPLLQREIHALSYVVIHTNQTEDGREYITEICQPAWTPTLSQVEEFLKGTPPSLLGNEAEEIEEARSSPRARSA